MNDWRDLQSHGVPQYTWFYGDYYECDIGRFSAGLVRDDIDSKTLIAVTCVDGVHVKDGYEPSDREAVEKFAEQYDLSVKWRDGQ